MGRAAITNGTSDGRPSIVDRFGTRPTLHGQGPLGDPSNGTSRVGSLLPEGTRKRSDTSAFKEAVAGQEEVDVNEIWFQLSLSDRQCFGHRFSGMVLKALGLRVCSAKEAEA
jgi:hypothetical protein